MKEITEVAAAMKGIVGEEHVSTARAVREHHGRDQSSHKPSLPDLVVWPAETDHVSALLGYANRHSIPVVGWGAGSSLEGNPIPVRGGIVVDFARMNQILEIHADDFQVRVQPGILYQDMNKSLGAYGLFFAPDPGANASIGGMVANNAAGIRTVKYGATRDNVLALEVVLADGQVVRTGSRSVKQSSGYDLTHLFTGSEGTLGLVTEATLRLVPIPAHFSAFTSSFPSVEEAAATVYAIMGSGLDPAAIELLDARTVGAMNEADDLGLPPGPNLLLEFHGPSRSTLEAEVDTVRSICQENGCLTFETAIGREARDLMWDARHRLGELLFRLHAGHDYLIGDVSVPISHYPHMVAHANMLLRELGVIGYIFGHAGDGNVHTIVVFPKGDGQILERVSSFNDRLVAEALRRSGTSTGEHGIGIGKQKYMVHEHGEAAVALMRALKSTLDPKGILNPGKILSF